MQNTEQNWVIENYDTFTQEGIIKHTPNQKRTENSELKATTQVDHVPDHEADQPGTDELNQYTEIQYLIYLVRSLAALDALQPMGEQNKYITTQICLLFLKKKNVEEFNQNVWKGQWETTLAVTRLVQQHSTLAIHSQKAAIVEILVNLNESCFYILTQWDKNTNCGVVLLTDKSRGWIRHNCLQVIEALYGKPSTWVCCCLPWLRGVANRFKTIE